MSGLIITSNDYRLPTGYQSGVLNKYRSSVAGYSILRTQNRAVLGATQILNVASVPADLSTLILNPPSGPSLTFQFVYNASVQTLGIKVPLPASGGSTAAQVTTALLAVLQVGSGTPLAGTLTRFPFVALTNTATRIEIKWLVNGTAQAITGTQATITVFATTAPAVAVDIGLPGMFGKCKAILAGQ
jgi:hypothetical protein